MLGLLPNNLMHIDHIQWQNMYVITNSLSNLDCASLNIIKPLSLLRNLIHAKGHNCQY
jgi:hypothetical protein